MLDTTERIRYACQIALPGFGEAAQERLKAARVLVAGAGGLGCPVAQYLVAAGVGQVTIADFDTVAAGNLHRQILYTPEDLGQFKAVVAARRLARQNPQVVVRAFLEKISPQNVLALFANHDLIVDCTDNFESRYLINDAAVLGGKPVVYGAIYQYEGQVALWNAPNADSTRSPHYRDLFPEVNAAAVPNCAEGGVLPALAGIIGCMQANAALQFLAGMADSLAGRLLVFDAATMQTRTFKIGSVSRSSITKLPQSEGAPSITADAWATARPDTYVVVDVRNIEERKQFPFPALHIPLADLGQRWTEIPDRQSVLFCCASGRRSAEAVKIWQQLRPDVAAFSLEGGIYSAYNLK
ncbi:MAG: HesA/MoeB/ThiF family protein [Saprospiraceae bacterium]